MRRLWRAFVECHEGRANRALHLLGGACLLLGCTIQNYFLMGTGLALQEGGHVYQYLKTGDLRHSPLTCVRPQVVFALPTLVLLAIYVMR